jgi:UDP-N-acetylglucosamine 2-epimerase (non-hydrolysing)
MKSPRKILVVFGTRPEAIKMAPLIHEFKKFPDCFFVKVCVTAQHREMLDQVLSVFDLVPDYDLNIMGKANSLSETTMKVLHGLEEVFKDFMPDLVFVHGDTTTTFSAALASFNKSIPVAHVEAGLRTFDVSSPFPEEFNRQAVSIMANYHFAPTESAASNLIKSNISREHVIVTGNTVIDALFWMSQKIEAQKNLKSKLSDEIKNIIGFDFEDHDYILVTAHRRENLGDGLKNICESLIKLSDQNPYLKFVFPVHFNPIIQKIVKSKLNKKSNIILIDPLPYPAFTQILRHSLIVLTDSGGIQEEAPAFGKPVFVLRETTERPEAVLAGTVVLVGTETRRVVDEVQKVLDDENKFSAMSSAHNPYGDGLASKKIVSYFREKDKC